METKNIIFVCILLVWQANLLEANDDQVECLGDVCDGNLIVTISNGVLRGKDNNFYYSYESIPYAEAPIGELRLENPVIYSQKWDEIFDATKAPVKCLQYNQFKDGEDKVEGFEDCLTVSVYRPKYVEQLLPVLILIHGGAFMFGNVVENDHSRLMKSGRLIVVKLNYRLGPLGFLSTEDDVISGNYGLKDQRLALEWVHENIINFGGDPERTMMVGFSAGGASVHLQMLQASVEDIVNVAVSVSGTAFNPWVIVHKPKEKAFKLADILKCDPISNSADIKKCLKEKKAEEIVGAVRHFLVFGYNPFTTFGPVVENAPTDQAFINKNPVDIITNGEYAKIPWLASYTKHDGVYNSAELVSKNSDGKDLIEEFNSKWLDLLPSVFFFRDVMSSDKALEFAKNLKETYLGEKDFTVENYQDVLRMYTDRLFKNGVEEAVRLHSEQRSSPVYTYVYDNPAEKGVGTTLSDRSDIDFGTGHGDDYFLLFSSPVRNTILREDEKINQDKFIKMIEDFVYTNGKLSFGSCDFVDNANQDELQLMFIGKYTCETKPVESFP